MSTSSSSRKGKNREVRFETPEDRNYGLAFDALEIRQDFAAKILELLKELGGGEHDPATQVIVNSLFTHPHPQILEIIFLAFSRVRSHRISTIRQAREHPNTEFIAKNWWVVFDRLEKFD